MPETDELWQPVRGHTREAAPGKAPQREPRSRRGKPEIHDQAGMDGRCADSAVVGRERLGLQPGNPGEQLIPAGKIPHVAPGWAGPPRRELSGDRVRVAAELKHEVLDPAVPDIVPHG